MKKFQQQTIELEDVISENHDLQETVMKKDTIIDELEKQMANVKLEADVKLKRTLDKLRLEYELMARSAVSTRLRKMNEYLEEKSKRQEELDNNRDNVAKSIQMDLEERLSSTVEELNQIRDKLKSKNSLL